VDAVSQRRAEVWKVRAADGPFRKRPLAPIESNREFIVLGGDWVIVVVSRGVAEAAKLTMRSWGSLAAAMQGSKLKIKISTFGGLTPTLTLPFCLVTCSSL